MNMEPLVPALPSTNEYEETTTDNGRLITYSTHTQTHTPTHIHAPLPQTSGKSHVVLFRRSHMHNAQTESVN